MHELHFRGKKVTVAEILAPANPLDREKGRKVTAAPGTTFFKFKLDKLDEGQLLKLEQLVKESNDDPGEYSTFGNNCITKATDTLAGVGVELPEVTGTTTTEELIDVLTEALGPPVEVSAEEPSKMVREIEL